jgi:ABC-type amino acid transport substrate-binding protein
MQRRRAAIAAGLALLAGRAVNPASPLRMLRPGLLTIGTYFVNPHFEFRQNGRQIGYEFDLMNEIARQLGLRPGFVNTHWEMILQKMQDHQYDCIVGGITITPARQRILA